MVVVAGFIDGGAREKRKRRSSSSSNASLLPLFSSLHFILSILHHSSPINLTHLSVTSHSPHSLESRPSSDSQSVTPLHRHSHLRSSSTPSTLFSAAYPLACSSSCLLLLQSWVSFKPASSGPLRPSSSARNATNSHSR